MRTNIRFQPDEEVIFEDEKAVLTNRRLIGNFASERGGDFDASELRDIGPPNKFNGGYQGKRPLGLRLLLGGVAVVVVSSVAQDRIGIPQTVEAVLFLVGALSATVGMYLVLNSLFRNPPNTTVIFPVLEGEDIIASYPEWDNPEAEQLVRHFARTKRGIGR